MNPPDPVTDRSPFDAHGTRVGGGPHPPADHAATDAHCTRVGGGQDFHAGQRACDPHRCRAGVEPHILNGQSSSAAHPRPAGEEQTTPAASGPSTPKPDAPLGSQAGRDHDLRVAHATSVPAPNSAAAKRRPTPSLVAPLRNFYDPVLALRADILDDLEAVRIANENRVRQLTRTEVDKDGVVRGAGIDGGDPEIASVQAIVDGLRALEHQAVLQLGRALRKHPMGPWMKAAKGIGPQQGARLLAALFGDPGWNFAEDRPRRGPAELWAYCGYHTVPASDHRTSDTQDVGVAGGSDPRDGQWWCDTQSVGVVSGQTGNPDPRAVDAQGASVGVAPKRRKGAHSNWNDEARKRAWCVAAKCVMVAQSPYRAVYDQARAKYANAVHRAECKQCGPKGKPAPVGSALSAGHQHARALRIVAKAILKDMWREADRLRHEEA